jgi:hypothetical protein
VDKSLEAETGIEIQVVPGTDDVAMVAQTHQRSNKTEIRLLCRSHQDEKMVLPH